MALYDLSIVIPGIRTHLWQQVYDTIAQSCKRYTWELIMSGPFDPPASLAHAKNFKYFKNHYRPSSSIQSAAEHCEGRLYNGSADDTIFLPDTLDLAIDLYNKLDNRKVCISNRYTEGDNHTGVTFPDSFWFFGSHPPLCVQGIPGNYRTCMSPMMDYEMYKYYGGLDCAYEYPNFSLHCLAARIAYDGVEIVQSPTNVNTCDHYGNRSMDHAEIEDAHDVDMALFRRTYDRPGALHPGMVCLPFDNWKNYTQPWERRFSNKLYTSYKDMMADKGVHGNW